MEDRIAVMQEEAKAEVSEGGVADMSQKELDDLAAKTTEELEVAKTAKDFPTCMELQVAGPFPSRSESPSPIAAAVFSYAQGVFVCLVYFRNPSVSVRRIVRRFYG